MIYVALIELGGAKPTLQAFKNRDHAIQWARLLMQHIVTYPELLRQADIGDAWLMRYMGTKDCAWVFPVTVIPAATADTPPQSQSGP